MRISSIVSRFENTVDLMKFYISCFISRRKKQYINIVPWGNRKTRSSSTANCLGTSTKKCKNIGIALTFWIYGFCERAPVHVHLKRCQLSLLEHLHFMRLFSNCFLYKWFCKFKNFRRTSWKIIIVDEGRNVILWKTIKNCSCKGISIK